MRATSTTTLFLCHHWAGESDLFKLTAHDSYLYACGVADNKGPVLAIACAAADLLRVCKLGVDILPLVKGKEETGSDSFVNAALMHKVLSLSQFMS